jgi:hypothetical protein
MDTLIESLVVRYERSVQLLEAYNQDIDNLSLLEKGYAQGIREEVQFLEHLLDSYVQAPAGVV